MCICLYIHLLFCIRHLPQSKKPIVPVISALMIRVTGPGHFPQVYVMALYLAFFQPTDCVKVHNDCIMSFVARRLRTTLMVYKKIRNFIYKNNNENQTENLIFLLGPARRGTALECCLCSSPLLHLTSYVDVTTTMMMTRPPCPTGYARGV